MIVVGSGAGVIVKLAVGLLKASWIGNAVSLVGSTPGVMLRTVKEETPCPTSCVKLTDWSGVKKPSEALSVTTSNGASKPVGKLMISVNNDPSVI